MFRSRRLWRTTHRVRIDAESDLAAGFRRPSHFDRWLLGPLVLRHNRRLWRGWRFAECSRKRFRPVPGRVDRITRLRAIGNSGTAVVRAGQQDFGASIGTFTFRVESIAVPEPATFVLFGAGLLGILVARKRKTIPGTMA
jgi:PEP-CTERM motif